ncbi:porin family protein [Flavobacterium zepuense]|uniref:Porin family protein n=1 Tax=Flavobacterium zepuense TaxID=2593302 RepID=A0A552V2S3_9FLAO|nr:outer membrane beta-barrel protein [Flavobacterium zepuense]TRW24774.1 porin family protein [Flavobacterium zepuense]
MKKILFIAALMVCGFANAQETVTETAPEGFKKGDIILTGAIGFGTSKTGEIKRTSYGVTPSAAYFVTNNIALGVSLGYSHFKQDSYINIDGFYPQRYDEVLNSFSADAYGRYYFTPASKFSIFGQLSAGFFTSKREVKDTAIEYTNNGFDATLAPGISYFISSHLALEASFGFINYRTVEPTTTDYYGNEIDEDSTDNFSANLYLSNIYFGLVYKF